MSELKPCPFCGKKAIEADNKIVYCSGRSCIVSFIKKEQWQSRPIEDALQAKLDDALMASRDNVDWFECLKVDYDKLQRKLDIAKEALKETRLNINSGKLALFSTDTMHVDDAKFYIKRSIILIDEALQQLEEK